MATSTFNQQLRALVRRNFSLKYQKLLITISELVLPMIMVIIVSRDIHHHKEKQTYVFNPSVMKVCMYPAEKDVQTVGNLFNSTFQEATASKFVLDFLESNQDSKNTTLKLQTGDCDVVVLFKNSVRHTGNYEIRILNEKTASGFDFAHINQQRNDSLLLILKMAVDTALIQYWTQNYNLDLWEPLMSLVSAPGIQEGLSQADKENNILLPLCLVFGYSFHISILCLDIVQEKERKIKETNVIMGLSIPAYWIAWFLVEFGIITVTSILQMLLLYYLNVFPNVKMGLVFTLLQLFGCSVIFLAFMMTPFFQSSKTVASVSSAILILSGLFYFIPIFMSDVMSRPMYFLISLLSPSAFTLAIQKICELNIISIRSGFTCCNLFEGKFSVADAMIMLVIDTVIYALLTYLFDNILSEEALGFCGINIGRKHVHSGQSQDRNCSVDITEQQADIEPQEDTTKESIKQVEELFENKN